MLNVLMATIKFNLFLWCVFLFQCLAVGKAVVDANDEKAIVLYKVTEHQVFSSYDRHIVHYYNMVSLAGSPIRIHLRQMVPSQRKEIQSTLLCYYGQ